MLKRFLNKTARKGANFLTLASRRKIINIDSGGKGVSAALSNFAKAPFIFEGRKFASFESFWQSLKFEENSPERKKIEESSGIDAKRAVKNTSTGVMHYGGKKLQYGSRELLELAKKAERARFEQNPEQLNALLSTGNARLIHFVSWTDSKSLPRKEFCRILLELREEFRKKSH